MGSAVSQTRSVDMLPLPIQEGGIGCVLEKVDGKVCIAAVLKSGAAASSKIGFCEGDAIVQVNDKEFTSSVSCDQVAAALRGKIHTTVRVWIRRKTTGKLVSARIVRQLVPGKPVKEAIHDDGHDIPVLAPKNDPARRILDRLQVAGFLQAMDRSGDAWEGHAQKQKGRGANKDPREPTVRYAPCLKQCLSAPPSECCYFA
jgi:hypothetical protein